MCYANVMQIAESYQGKGREGEEGKGREDERGKEKSKEILTNKKETNLEHENKRRMREKYLKKVKNEGHWLNFRQGKLRHNMN